MVSEKRVTCSPPPPLFLVSGDGRDFLTSPKSTARTTKAPHEWATKAVPKENLSVDDATGYSKEEEEATSVSCEEFL